MGTAAIRHVDGLTSTKPFAILGGTYRVYYPTSVFARQDIEVSPKAIFMSITLVDDITATLHPFTLQGFTQRSSRYGG